MAYGCTMVRHSVSPAGVELPTMEVTFPRIVLSEFRTHRLLTEDDEWEMVFKGMDDAGRDVSINSGSSRAIPVKTILERVVQDPFIPVHWGQNQKGMQAEEEISEKDKVKAIRLWLQARDNAVRTVKTLVGIQPSQTLDPDDNLEVVRLNVHKQIANRLLEPWMWQTCIVSGTQWSNFFAQRCHKDAQPEIHTIANMMRHTLATSEPMLVKYGEWHLPYIQDDEWDLPIETLKRLSSARCARVSYLTQNGLRETDLDMGLFERLLSGPHWSPLEHVATPYDTSTGLADLGNYEGWLQFRKTFPGECR